MTEPVVSVLVVDDEPQFRTGLERLLSRNGCEVRTASSVSEARAALEQDPVDLAIVDFCLGDGDGPDIVRWAMAKSRMDAAYCMTGNPTTAHVVAAMRAGCADVIEKPFDTDRITAIVEERRARARHDLQSWRKRYAPELLGEDPALLELIDALRNVAATQCTVMIGGESGSGKELAARALHRASPRRDKPFVALNCAAIPEQLIEAELFGHVRGAFTGAVGAREGRIVAAHGGTLFLDEIGDMPLAAQAKLLRVLTDACLTPVGADHPIPIDVRVVAATHRDLEGMVEAGTFRDDLYFRLAVVTLVMPPLRERPGDVLPLARSFLMAANHRTGRDVADFDDGAKMYLQEHAWPGNVRELANAVERAVVLKGSGMVRASDLQGPRRRRPTAQPAVPPAPTPRLPEIPSHMSAASPPVARPAAPPVATAPAAPPAGARPESLDLRAAIDGVERRMILEALDRTGGNRTEAAALLGLNRTTLVEKLRKLGS
jgi:DNA-binding NtrC family response regulator